MCNAMRSLDGLYLKVLASDLVDGISVAPRGRFFTLPLCVPLHVRRRP